MEDQGKSEAFSVRLPSRAAYVASVSSFVCGLIRNIPELQGRPKSLGHELELVISEALTNVIRHAHRGDAAKPMVLEFHVDAGEIRLEVVDTGPGFEYSKPSLPEDPLAQSGRGLYMIQRVCDSVEYIASPSGNRLVMRKSLDSNE